MKYFLFIITVITFAVSVEAANVGVSVNVGQPGFYGQINIGDFPKPQIVFPEPVMITPMPMGAAHPPPIYMHVPPGHEKKWNKHCHKYNACNRPVYFVRDKWYNDTYVPEYHARHGRNDGGHDDKDNNQGKGRGKGHGKDKGKGHGRD